MNKMQKPLQERVQKLAKKYGVKPERIEEIEQTVWEFVRKEMSKGSIEEPDTYQNILLKYLGTFHIMPRKLQFFKDKENDRQE